MGVTFSWEEVQLLAKLGGYEPHKDRFPGKIVLLRGLSRLLEMLSIPGHPLPLRRRTRRTFSQDRRLFARMAFSRRVMSGCQPFPLDMLLFSLYTVTNW